MGKVLWEDPYGEKDIHPRFYVGLDLTQGWVSTLLTYSPVGNNAIIHVHYDYVQLSCPNCGSHQHGPKCCVNIALPMVNRMVVCLPQGRTECLWVTALMVVIGSMVDLTNHIVKLIMITDNAALAIRMSG